MSAFQGKDYKIDLMKVVFFSSAEVRINEFIGELYYR